jgi:hypothetical protein
LRSMEYLVSCNLTVAVSGPGGSGSTVTLTIRPGVTVYFDPGRSLTIGQLGTGVYYGALDAAGTLGNKIVFTSSSSNPQPGDWEGINLAVVSPDVPTVVDHVIVEYSGGFWTNLASIRIDNGTPTVQNTIVRSNTTGVTVRGGTPLLLNNSIDQGVVCEAGSPMITGNDILVYGQYGLDIQPPCVAAVTNNTFGGNGWYPIRSHANRVSGIGRNTFLTGTGSDRVQIGNIVTIDSTWSDPGTAFEATAGLSVHVEGPGGAGSTVTLTLNAADTECRGESPLWGRNRTEGWRDRVGRLLRCSEKPGNG